MSKLSYKDMAMKPVEFPNLKDITNNLERLKKENTQLKAEVSRLQSELRDAKGDANYVRSSRVKNLDVLGTSLKPARRQQSNWGDDDSDTPETCEFTDDPREW